MPRGKTTIEERLHAVIACIENRMSQSEAARQLGIDQRNIQEWILRYKASGPEAFLNQDHNTVYPIETKLQAVREYLSGSGSQAAISAKYGLKSRRQLYNWIKCYNNGRIFERKILGGSRMKQCRETTQEERIAIAKDCLENGSNFGEAAIRHNVSYQQVYTWVKKYKEMGSAGLEDRRGKRTAQQTPRSELEAAKIEIEQLKHKLYLSEMENNLLKKLNELERGDAFLK